MSDSKNKFEITKAFVEGAPAPNSDTNNLKSATGPLDDQIKEGGVNNQNAAASYKEAATAAIITSNLNLAPLPIVLLPLIEKVPPILDGKIGEKLVTNELAKKLAKNPVSLDVKKDIQSSPEEPKSGVNYKSPGR